MSIVLAILGHFPVFPDQHLSTSINPRENGNSKSTYSSPFSRRLKAWLLWGCMFKVADLFLFDKGPGGGRSQNGPRSFITEKHPAQTQ